MTLVQYAVGPRPAGQQRVGVGAQRVVRHDDHVVRTRVDERLQRVPLARRALVLGTDGKFRNVFSAFWASPEFRNVPGNVGHFLGNLGNFGRFGRVVGGFQRLWAVSAVKACEIWAKLSAFSRNLPRNFGQKVGNLALNLGQFHQNYPCLPTWYSSGRSTSASTYRAISCAQLQRRKLNLKAKVESSMSHFSFKRLVPGGFNLGLIGSTCTALPSARPGWAGTR